MGRNVSKLDPKLLDKVERLLAEGKLQGQEIAEQCKIDRRWIADIKRHLAKRALAAIEPRLPPSTPKEKQEEQELALKDYRKLLRQKVPLKDRVKALHQLLTRGSVQVQLRALERIDAIEGLNKIEQGDVAPLFEILDNEEPDVRRLLYTDDCITTVELWITDWELHTGDDDLVTITATLGRADEDRVQTLLRALHTNVPVGLTPKSTKPKEREVTDIIQEQEAYEEMEVA